MGHVCEVKTEVANNNLAYDFDALEKHYAASDAAKVRQPAQLHVVENRNAKSKDSFMRGAVIFMVIAVLICVNLYNKMLLTELTTQIETRQEQYELLQNENRLMNMQLESMTSLRAVSEIAENELGMAEVESYQIEYIDLGAGDRVVLAKAPELSLANHIEKAYYSVLEYLGF